MNITTFGGHNLVGVMRGGWTLCWEVGDAGLNITDRSGKTWAYPTRRGDGFRPDVEPGFRLRHRNRRSSRSGAQP
jgi:hypothetical protein